MDIRKRIAFFRSLKGLTVNALANLAGVSQSYLRDIELGNKNPTVNFIEVICETLNISLIDFFDENNTTKFENDPLIKRVYQMTPEQREALVNLLEPFKK